MEYNAFHMGIMYLLEKIPNQEHIQKIKTPRELWEPWHVFTAHNREEVTSDLTTWRHATSNNAKKKAQRAEADVIRMTKLQAKENGPGYITGGFFQQSCMDVKVDHRNLST